MKWIKHDTDANQDAKLQNVMLDYGLEGYGLYWYCIELIAGKVDKDNINFDLEHDARIIAKNTGSTPQKVEEMMRYLVRIGLFEDSTGVITCLKLAKRLDKSMTSNAEMRAIIDNLKSHDPIITKSDKPMTQSDKPMQDKIRSEENRIDETRVDKIKYTPVKLDFSVLLITDDQVKQVIKIRKDRKGAKYTQRTINRLANQLQIAFSKGFTIEDVLTKWEDSTWKSFEGDWMKAPNQGAGQMQENLNVLSGITYDRS